MPDNRPKTPAAGLESALMAILERVFVGNPDRPGALGLNVDNTRSQQRLAEELRAGSELSGAGPAPGLAQGPLTPLAGLTPEDITRILFDAVINRQVGRGEPAQDPMRIQ